MLGELSGSMAHELNQPLTAILSNAQAAQRFLAQDKVDLNEVTEILADIVDQDHRAGEVIRRLRLLLKEGEVHQQPLNVNEVLQEGLRLIRNDLVNRGVVLTPRFAPSLPPAIGDRVQLQQVLVNLVMNACDAMTDNAPANRRVVVSTELSNGQGVLCSVSDLGPGIPSESLEQVFSFFFTTKSHGLGVGLAVCRSIIVAHGGRLWASNNPEGGATFHFTLPVTVEATA
jgi:two-component system, LuxR family, sensor kinase FixL